MIKLSKNNKVFIPLSIEQTAPGKQHYFFSAQKGVMMALALIPGIITIPLFASLTPGSIRGMILGFIVYGIAYLLFLRFFIFEEITWKRIFLNLHKNKMSDHNYFWGIDRVSDNGIIHYKYSGESSLKKAVVVKLIRGSRIGRGENYEEEYKEVIRRILHTVLYEGGGYSVNIYSIVDDSSIPESMKKMYAKASNIESDVAREIAMEHINNLALQAKYRKKIETVYLLLSTEDFRLYKKILDVAFNITNIAKNSRIFKIAEVLNKREVEDFITQYLCVNMLTQVTDVNNEEVKDFREYGDIIRVFDENGEEEWVELDLESAETSQNKRFSNEDIINNIRNKNGKQGLFKRFRKENKKEKVDEEKDIEITEEGLVEIDLERELQERNDILESGYKRNDK